MIFKAKKNFVSLSLLFFLLGGVSAQAGMSKSEFVAECMRLATGGNAGPTYTCSAASAHDADLLRSIGVDDTVEVDAGEASVGSWGDGSNSYYSGIAFQVKWGIFGGKSLRVSCSESAQGDVQYDPSSSRIRVDIEGRIDGSETATVNCR